MRISPYVPLAVVCALATACQLPERRPDANALVKSCDEGPSFGREVGALVRHGACLVLDPTTSTVYAGGTATYEWTAEITRGEPIFTTTSWSLGSSADPLQGRFFANEAVNDTKVVLQLRVRDGHGHDRTHRKEIYLTNERPALTERAHVTIPRTASLARLPFLVVRPHVTDADDDHLSVAVTQTSGPVTTGYPCREVPTRSMGLYPDPAPDEPAWCIELRPVSTATGPDLLVDEEISLGLRIEPYETYGVPPTGAACGDPRVACEEWRLTSAAWATLQFGNQLVRTSDAWVRIPASPSAPGIAVAAGRAWIPTMEIVDAPDGGKVSVRKLVGYGAGAPVELSNIGVVRDIVAGTADVGGTVVGGLWIEAMSVDTAGNPSVQSASPQSLAVDEVYLVFVPDGLLAASGDLASIGRESFRFVRGFFPDEMFEDAEHPLSFVSTADGALWIATTVGFQDRLRHLPASMLAASPAVSVDDAADLALDANSGSSILKWAQPLVGMSADVGERRLHVLAAGPDGVWAGGNLPSIDEPHLWYFRASGPDAETIPLAPVTSGGNIRYDSPHHLVHDPAGYFWVSLATRDPSVGGPQTAQTLVRVDAQTGHVDPVGLFSNLAALALDPDGGLWIEDIVDEESFSNERQVSYLPAGAAPIAGQWPLQSTEPFDSQKLHGIATGTWDGRSMVWFAEYARVVAAPAGALREFSLHATLPAQGTIVGVDTRRGDALVSTMSSFTDETTLFAVDGGSGELTPLLVIGSSYRATATYSPPFLAYDRSEMSPGGLWISVARLTTTMSVDTDVVRLDHESIDALRAGALRRVEEIPDCTATTAPPCWSSRVPLGERFPLRLVLSPVDERLYAAAYALDGNTVVARLLAMPAYGDALEAEVDVSMTATAPLTPFLHRDGTVWKGGVWHGDGSRVSRWHVSGTDIVEDASLRVEPADADLPVVQVVSDASANRTWATFRANGPVTPGDPSGGVNVYFALPVTNGGPAGGSSATEIAPVPFSSRAWGSASELVRLRYDGSTFHQDYAGITSVFSLWTGCAQ